MQRPRLDRRLDEAALEPLTVLRAPAGSGKTVAVASWLLARTVIDRTAWLPVDESMRSPAAFWRAFIRAMRQTESEEDEPSATDALEALKSEPGTVTVVIDDFHHAHATISAELVRLLERHTRLHLIVLTRALTELEGSHVVARLGTSVIPPQDLFFTAEESAGVFRAWEMSRTKRELTLAHEHLGGWPHATQVLASELSRHPEATIEQAIIRLEVMESWDPGGAVPSEVTSFVRRVSVARRFDVELASRLNGGADAAALVREVESHGLLVATESIRGVEYRLNDLVRGILLARLRRDNAVAYELGMKETARWEAERGDPVAGSRMAAEIEAWELLGTIVMEHVTTLLARHRDELMELLEVVPWRELQKRPPLVVILTLLHYASPVSSGDRIRALSSMALSVLRTYARPRSSVDRLWLQATLLGALRTSGRYAQSAHIADRLLRLLAEMKPDELRAIAHIRVLVTTQAATSYVYTGASERALPLFAEAVRLAADRNAYGSLHGASMEALVLALRGDMVEARTTIATFDVRDEPAEWRGTYSAAGFHIASAIDSLERFDPDVATAELRALDRHFSTIEHWPMIAAIDARAALISGDIEEGIRQLRGRVSSRRARNPTSAPMRALMDAELVSLHLAAGQINRARQIADAAPVAAVTSIARARIALLENDHSRIPPLLLAGHVDDDTAPRTRVSASLLLAAAYVETGELELARQHAGMAFDVADREQLYLPLALMPRAVLLPLGQLVGETIGASHPLAAVRDLYPAAVSPKLTPRELAVLRELQVAASSSAIAKALFVSPNTVKSQLRSIYSKLDVSTRDDALAAAARLGLISSER